MYFSTACVMVSLSAVFVGSRRRSSVQRQNGVIPHASAVCDAVAAWHGCDASDGDEHGTLISGMHAQLPKMTEFTEQAAAEGVLHFTAPGLGGWHTMPNASATTSSSRGARCMAARCGSRRAARVVSRGRRKAATGACSPRRASGRIVTHGRF